jgi:virginiamycin B lyase
MRLLGILAIALSSGLLQTTAAMGQDLAIEDLVVEAEIKRRAINTAFGFNSLWAANGFTVLRISATNNETVEFELEGASQKQRPIIIGDDAVWIADVGSDLIFKIDPKTNAVAATLPVDMLSTRGSIAIGEGSVWVVIAEEFEKTVARYDADTGHLQASIKLPSSGVGMAFGFGSVWVTSNTGDALYRIDPATNTVVSTTDLADGPRYMTTGQGSVWVHIQSDASIQRIDGQSGELLATIETGLPRGAAFLDLGGGFLWMNTVYKVPLAQIDPGTNKLVRRFSGQYIGGSIRFGAGSLWVGGATIKRITPPN